MLLPHPEALTNEYTRSLFTKRDSYNHLEAVLSVISNGRDAVVCPLPAKYLELCIDMWAGYLFISHHFDLNRPIALSSWNPPLLRYLAGIVSAMLGDLV